MSQTETHFGKLRKVDLEGQTLEQWCEYGCRERGINEISSYHETWIEEFRYAFDEKYFLIDGEVWETFDHIEGDDSGDIDIMIPNLDGTITFVQQFYNGGTCLSEVIEEGIKRLKTDKKI
jgi:hypothetical protein